MKTTLIELPRRLTNPSADHPGGGVSRSVPWGTGYTRQNREKRFISVNGPEQKSLSIFVVEDHSDTRKCICSYLEGMGHTIHAATTMKEALEKLSAVRCDLLVSDIGLPDGDGCELLRNAQLPSAVYAVAVSGFGMGADRVKSKAAGFHRHLLKPFGHEELDAMVRDAVEHRRRQPPDGNAN